MVFSHQTSSASSHTYEDTRLTHPADISPMTSPAFWSAPLKYIKYTAIERPHILASYVMGVGGPLAALTLYGAREKYLYADAPLIPLAYPLPAQRNPNLRGYDDK